MTNINDDTVSVLNTATCNATNRSSCRRVAPTIQVGLAPVGLAVDPTDRTVYATNVDTDTVSVVNAATCNAGATVGCRHEAPTVQTGRHRYGTDGIAVSRVG